LRSAQRNFPVYSFLDDTSKVSVIQRDVVFRRRRRDAHGLTFMRTNDANDDPPNSRRPSLQTITPVALIFSWLLFDGTTRKCIIRRWRSPTTRLESRLFLSLPLALSLSLFLSRPRPPHLARAVPLLFELAPRAEDDDAIPLATSLLPPHPPRINYEQKRAGRSARRSRRSCSVRSHERRDRKLVLTRCARERARMYVTRR